VIVAEVNEVKLFYVYDIVRNGNALALGIFLQAPNTSCTVHTITYMPVCNGLLYIALANRACHLNLEDTVSGTVYTVHGDATDTQYRNFEEQRPTRAAELPRRAKASASRRPKVEICYRHRHRHKRYSASCMNKCGSYRNRL